MEGRISVLTLLCFVLSGVDALTVNIPEDIYEVARGDNITLPCSFQPKPNNLNNPTKLTVISWSVEAPEPNAKEIQFITYYSNGKVLDIKSLYEGRVSLDVDVAKGKADLKLSSITLAENKVFECRVMIPGDDEGTPADKARLVVLVAPSKPICNIQGEAMYGKNINLTCVSEEGSPTPTYKWESRDVKNTPRIASPRTTDKGGILSLYNISKDTSGYYICTSKNKIRSATCNLTLSVMPPSMNIGSTAGIIGGVVAALIVLIVIIYFCCCRKKKQQEEYAMGVPEEEYHDKEPARNGDSRQVEGQEDREDYDASSMRNTSDRQDRYEEESERGYDRRKDYDDRHSDYDDHRSDYDDRRRDNDDRRKDYDDRRRDYDDRRSDYDDRPSDRREPYEDERRYDDSRDRRSNDDRRDRRSNDDRYDEPYDDRELDRPPVPANKPPRRDYDD